MRERFICHSIFVVSVFELVSISKWNSYFQVCDILRAVLFVFDVSGCVWCSCVFLVVCLLKVAFCFTCCFCVLCC